MASLREIRNAMRDEIGTTDDQVEPDWLASQRAFDDHVLPDDQRDWLYIGYMCEQRRFGGFRTRRQ